MKETCPEKADRKSPSGTHEWLSSHRFKRCMSVVAILLVLIPLFLYRAQETLQLDQLKSLIWGPEEKQIPGPRYRIEHLDIKDEEEYRKLGLTPQRPIKIIPIASSAEELHSSKSKVLHGRFLHITDMHPDEEYEEGSSIKKVCHGGKPSKNSDRASKYGDATRGCDSPMVLMEDTLKWVQENLKDKIDFVIWTGDNIRHDNDRKYPRTERKIFEMNRLVADLFYDAFHNKDEPDPRKMDVAIIPSLGNNDVYPHNLFSPGPTLQTMELWTIWENFISEKQMHIFEKGAYFFSEVIPGELAVLSINTLYLFKSNPLTESCDKKKDPGYELFKWLGITLEELRSRGMKVWLSGHVPPIPKNFDISCYRKFAVWVHEYRDIIIGGVYGHMNIDHFIPADAQKAYKSLVNSYIEQGYTMDDDLIKYMSFQIDEEEDEFETDHDLETQYLKLGHDIHGVDADKYPDFSTCGAAPGNNKKGYIKTVRETFYADVKGPKKAGVHAERYAITNVAASVIPTFNPGIRVWEYNITGIEDKLLQAQSQKPWDQFFAELENKMFSDEYEDEEEKEQDYHSEEVDATGRRKKKRKKKKSPKDDPTFPPKKPEDIPLGPAYTPQLYSPTKFVQYYIDLKAVSKGEKEFGYEVEYKSTDAPMSMQGLLVEDYVKLARKLGKPVKRDIGQNLMTEEENGTSKYNQGDKDESLEKDTELGELWETFMKFAFVSSGYDE